MGVVLTQGSCVTCDNYRVAMSKRCIHLRIQISNESYQLVSKGVLTTEEVVCSLFFSSPGTGAWYTDAWAWLGPLAKVSTKVACFRQPLLPGLLVAHTLERDHHAQTFKHYRCTPEIQSRGTQSLWVGDEGIWPGQNHRGNTKRQVYHNNAHEHIITRESTIMAALPSFWCLQPLTMVANIHHAARSIIMR